MSQPPNPCADSTETIPLKSPVATPNQGDSFLLLLLEERLAFERLLAQLSTRFIHLQPEEIDGQIERGLQQIVEFLQIEHSSLSQFSEDGSKLVVTHSYSIPGFDPMPRVDLAALWPSYTAQIRAGNLVRFSQLPHELPPDAASAREYSQHHWTARSQLGIPFKVGESILGALGFGSFYANRVWSDELIASLQLVGEIFANALARKRSEMALHASERRFQLMADAAPVMVWLSGRDKLCTYFNKPWLDFTGEPLHRQIGNGWSEGVHPDDLQSCLDTYVRAFDARQTFRMEYRLRRFDGEYRWILDIGAPRFESDGAFEGYVGSCVDVTDQKRAAEESRVLREQLAHVGRVSLMGELTASIAHEVNQPLCAIVSNAQALQRSLGTGQFDDEEMRAALRDITHDGQRASAVIAGVRGFLRKATVPRSPVDVNDLIREVAELVRSEMMNKLVTMKLQLAEKLPPVLGDRIQLQQVILNLMANGADAMDHVKPEMRELVIRSGYDASGTVAVAVTDAGVGLDPEKMGRVFEAFFTTKPNSLGMGLAICKGIVESHGGRIEVIPHAGRGSTFRFALPVARENTP
jgi:two-component system, LuxR family, sensor kinase FixL